MTTTTCAPTILGAVGAPMQTRLDDEVVDVRLDGATSRRVPAALTGTLCVLVADDCQDSADSLSMLVRIWGHDVRVAYSAPAALERALADRPDVLLLDIAMPGMDGYELARQIRRHRSLDDSLLVAVTGYADEAHRRRGRAAGFDHYLVKPGEPSDMDDLLRLEKDRRVTVRATQTRAAR